MSSPGTDQSERAEQGNMTLQCRVNQSVMPNAETFLHRLINQNVERTRNGVMPIVGTFPQEFDQSKYTVSHGRDVAR